MRATRLQRLHERRVQVLVVGGGISGAGIALEASLRGYSCALVERRDFASGTSRRSTKLIHGGLRYLLHGATEFVTEALAERSFLLEHAPDLVHPLSMLLLTSEPPAVVERMLATYERLGEPWAMPRHRQVDAAELGQRAPFVAAGVGAFEYHEATADDAWLTLAVLQAAQAQGAEVCNWLELRSFDTGSGTVRANLHDAIGGETLTVEAETVVLAVGAWLGAWASGAELCPAKGTHVVLRQTDPPLQCGLAMAHPADGRFVTLTPWHDHLLLGSTDAECDLSELDCPLPTTAEVEYLLAATTSLAPDWQPTVTAAWSGVRPLLGPSGARTADLSREDRLLDLAPGVIGIAGGKLTTFRRLAQRTLDRIDSLLGRSRAAAPFPRLDRAGENWMAATLDDVLTQRQPLSLLEPAVADESARRQATALAPDMGWSDHERDRQVASYRADLRRFRRP